MRTIGTRTVLSKTPYLIALAVSWVFGSFARLEAGTILEYYDDGSASWKLIASSPAKSTTVGFFAAGGFELYNATAASNIPGSLKSSFLAGADAIVWNKSGATATIKLTFGADGYLLPTAPPDATIQSHLGVTVFTDPTIAKVSMTSYVDELGRIGDATFTTPPPSKYVIVNTDPVLTSGSGSSDAFVVATSLSPTSLIKGYSVVQQVIVTLADEGMMNFVTNTTLSSVPEPTTMGILGVSVAGLFGYGFKRRLKKVEAV